MRSALALLRLWATLRETCYTGDGTAVVDMPGVYREQIVGRHEVCLAAVVFRSSGAPSAR
jgi:hypothetical protein